MDPQESSLFSLEVHTQQVLISKNPHLKSGNKLYNQGKFQKAFRAYKTALDKARSLNQADGPYLAHIYHKAGLSAFKKGDCNIGREFLTNALNIHKEKIKDQSSEVAYIMMALGGVFQAQAKYSDALNHFMGAADILENIKTLSPYKLRPCYNYLAELYEDQGKYTIAFRYLTQSLDIPSTGLEEDEKEIGKTYCLLGRSYQSVANYSQAMECTLKALEIWEKIYGVRNHPDLAICYNTIGNVYLMQGKMSEGLEKYKISLDMRLKFLEENHLLVSDSYKNIAVAYRRLGNFSMSSESYQKALQILISCFGELHPKISVVYNNLGILFASQKKDDEALRYFSQALEIKTRIHPDHLDLAMIHNNIGVIYLHQHENEKAKTHFSKAFEIRSKLAFTKMHPDVAVSHLNLGILYFREKHYFEAFTNHMNALKIWHSLFGTTQGDLSQSYSLLSKVFEEIKDLEMAENFVLKKKQIQYKLLGKDQTSVQFTKIEASLADKRKYVQENNNNLAV